MYLRYPIEEYYNAELCLWARKFKEAIRHSEKAFKKAQLMNDKEYSVKILCLIARTHNVKGRYTKDERYHDEALRLLAQAENIPFPSLESSFEILLEKGHSFLLKKT
jgi:hypothetical protein